MDVKVGDRVRLKEATVETAPAHGMMYVAFDNGTQACIHETDIAEVFPRPFAVGDRVTMGPKYVVWEIIFKTDQITIGRVVGRPILSHPLGYEGVINPGGMVRA